MGDNVSVAQHEEEQEQVSEGGENEQTEQEVEVAQEEPEESSESAGDDDAGGSDEDDQKALKVTVDDVNTAPMDFRFPTTNQAKHCFTRYNEYHKCIAEKGEDSGDCKKYAKYYRSLCPNEWVQKWNEQRENGTFAGRY